MKVIAFYLPQFHNIPENDEWWGDGFTEWVNVKKARPCFEGHRQPRVPLDNNYYDLMSNNVKHWQIELAKRAGLYGFCYYHYWFAGKLLLEKPMEQLLEDKSLDFPFCVSWANEPWTKAWVGENRVLIPQSYGSEQDWIEHFYYLLPFFRDSRYIKDGGSPLIVIYRPEVISCLNDMLLCWSSLAKKEGFPGLTFAYQHLGLDQMHGDNSLFKYDIEFQPAYAEVFSPKHEAAIKRTKFWAMVRWIKRRLFSSVERVTGVDIDRMIGNVSFRKGPDTFNYDDRWNDILDASPINERAVPGAFVDWDNSPRRGDRGKMCVGATPEKFRSYMERLIAKARDEYRSEYIFLTAWNEWAEGSYLEPDEEFGLGYIESLHQALEACDELP